MIPRSLSSGALSISSKFSTVFPGTLSARTFVIAAVKVVLPWSTCPMVQMLQCGFVHSNLAIAILNILLKNITLNGATLFWFSILNLAKFDYISNLADFQAFYDILGIFVG